MNCNNIDRYVIAEMWVVAIKKHWTNDFIMDSLRKCGVLPFTRVRHLEGNASLVSIADCIQRAEEMWQKRDAYAAREAQRREKTMTQEIEVSEPLGQSDLVTIANVFGDINLADDLVATCKEYKLSHWPRTEQDRHKTSAWRHCIEHSPALRDRLVNTCEVELRQMFNIGQIIDCDVAKLTPEQVHVPVIELDKTRTHTHKLFIARLSVCCHTLSSSLRHWC